MRSVLDISRSGAGVEVRTEGEVIRIEPWGPNSFRIRAALGHIDSDLPGALEEAPEPAEVAFISGDDRVSVANGAITAVVANEDGDGGQYMMIRFVRTDTGQELTAEQPAHFWWPGPRVFTPLGGCRYRLEQHFRAYDGERLFGLGQHTHGQLDQKGMALDLVQRLSLIHISEPTRLGM